MADVWFIVNLVVEVVIALLVILGNGLYLVTLAKNRHLQTVTNFLIASLTVADLSVGVFGIPSVIVTLFGLPHNLYGCLGLTCVIAILTQVSVFSLLAVAVERFIAIKYPFFHHVHFTWKTAFIASIINWILGIIIGFVPMVWNLGWNESNTCNFILIIDFKYLVYFHFMALINVPLIVMFFLYVAIFEVVRHHSRALGTEQVAPQGDILLAPTIKKELRAARKFALVIGLFGFCWLPLEIMNAITLWAGKTWVPGIIMAVWLTHLNSALNPLLYAYGSGAVKKAMLMTLRCGYKRAAESQSSSNSHSLTTTQK